MFKVTLRQRLESCYADNIMADWLVTLRYAIIVRFATRAPPPLPSLPLMLILHMIR